MLNKKNIYFLSVLLFLFLGFSSKSIANASAVEIWNGNVSEWTSSYASSTPVDMGITKNASISQLATDSTGKVYMTFKQANASSVNHIYLSRYNGTNVEIWNNDTSSWTTTFADGDPIDTGTGNNANSPQIVIDSDDNVYVTYIQSTGVYNRVFLSRYDGTSVKIWDGNAVAWTNTFANGTPIDPAATNNTNSPQLATDLTGKVYVTFTQGLTSHIYLSRYNGTDVRIWDNGASTWTTTFADGDPIDTGIAQSATEAQLAIDSTGKVYVIYNQSNGTKPHVYFTRYDGTNVRIWDNDTSSWTTTFANGDPIDTGISNNEAYSNQIAIDSNGKVYIVYQQSNGTNLHVYLSRYNGTDVRIWDNGASTWTTTFADGDPIDTGIAQGAVTPQLVIDSNGKVYVIYNQSNGTKTHIYLSRYNGTDVKIWDNGASTWTTTFADGDPIDTGAAYNAAAPQLIVDSNGKIYVTYQQYASGGSYPNIYLSRYDGTSVGIWDKDSVDWTTTFADGDPIDKDTNPSDTPQIAVDSTNNVYLVFQQFYSGFVSHVSLARYVAPIPVTHGITASAGSNGTISPNGETLVTDGTSQIYNITPSAGYHVEDVLVDSVSIGAVTSYEFTNVVTTHTISATFAVDTIPDESEESETSVTSHRSSGYVKFGCKDPKASNYEYFSRSKPELCKYDVITTVVTPYSFSRDLKFGMTGQDVMLLQQFLNINNFIVAETGAGSPGNETTTFGPATKAALIKYQEANKITPAIGYFGPITRAIVNK